VDGRKAQAKEDEQDQSFHGVFPVDVDTTMKRVTNRDGLRERLRE
jgi:hypothetical protein